jgi:Holliday junction resolvase
MKKKKLKLKPYVPKMTENDTRQQIRDYLDIKGWYYFPVVQGYGSRPGVSDYIAIKNGQIIFIEAKSTNGKQSDQQVEFQKIVEKNGYEYILTFSVDDLVERGI